MAYLKLFKAMNAVTEKAKRVTMLYNAQASQRTTRGPAGQKAKADVQYSDEG